MRWNCISQIFSISFKKVLMALLKLYAAVLVQNWRIVQMNSCEYLCVVDIQLKLHVQQWRFWTAETSAKIKTHCWISECYVAKNWFLQSSLIDYYFVIVYENFSFVRNIQEKSSIYPNRISVMINHLNCRFNEAWYKSLIKTNPFLKLTYKRTWIEETKDHELTYYGWLKKRYLWNIGILS